VNDMMVRFIGNRPIFNPPHLLNHVHDSQNTQDQHESIRKR
jgi:hypothetical protein